MFFNERSYRNATTNKEYMTPLTVSRATARMEEVKAFYSSDIYVETMHSETFEDGSEVLVVAFPDPE